jgi:hypothetical protein
MTIFGLTTTNSAMGILMSWWTKQTMRMGSNGPSAMNWGGVDGCKSTKHKTGVNQIRDPPPVVVCVPETTSRERKAET